TLEMLTHVSRNLSGARLLIVGTYRDVEVDRTHPLSAALAELRRVATFDRVLLRGLNADEVRRMLESITTEEVPWSLAEAVHRQTEGNPLFVQEVVRYIVEEGLISREGGQWRATRDTPLEMSIPEGLRDVVGKRLSGLSQECNRILSIASVIGRDFRLAVLQKVADVSDDELFAALEEAKGAAVVEERSMVGAAVSYRFTHAFFRQTLYEEIIAPRRIRLHQQVGKALEEIYEKRLEEHAAELAEHFSCSSDPVDLAKSVSYGEMAAERASSVYAYSEAVRLLEQALKVQEVLDPEDKTKQCDLMLTLGHAVLDAGQSRHVLDVEAPAALSLAEAISDNERASKACRLADEALAFYGAGDAYTTPEAAQWAERADYYANPDTAERVQADVTLGLVRFNTGHLRSGLRFARQALDLARQLDDLFLFRAAAQAYLYIANAPQHIEECVRLADELMQASREKVSLINIAVGLNMAAQVYFRAGQRERAEKAIGEFQNLAHISGQVDILLTSMQHEFLLATMDGRFDKAAEIVERHNTLADDVRWGLRRGEERVTGLRRLLYQGRDLETAHDALQRGTQLVTSILTRMLFLAYLGRKDEAEQILMQLVTPRHDIGSSEDETPDWWDIVLLEVAVLVKQSNVAALLSQRLAGTGVLTAGTVWATCTARHLGATAALLGKPDEARQHYQEAIRVCSEMRFRPEMALTRLQLAELLLEHYPDEKSEALEHLDFAINEFREMKMQPSLERALRHKEILGA
ncbi:MAG: hypothetical protein JSV77_04250, partial [Dehalococcoidales bacterium]